MKLIIGLGNPETRYNNTRHNTGFVCIDAFAKEHDASFKLKEKFKSFIAEVSIDGEKVLLAKPVTFYNASGHSFRALIDFYKIEPEDVLVVHDELSLPFGTVRNRIGGSDAGNNGIKSINADGGTQTSRIRVGVANEHRAVTEAVDFVLGKFSKSEVTTLHESLVPKIMKSIESFISGSFEPTSFSLALDQPEE